MRTNISIGKKFTAAVLALALGWLGTGCETARDVSLTHRLWSGSDLESECFPAANGRLLVHHSPAHDDFLVQYDEAKDRSTRVQPRSYFLRENADRLAARRKPNFVSKRSATDLTPVPVLAEPPATLPTGGYVLLAPDRAHFTMRVTGWPAGPYALPGYQVSDGTPARVALTPVAVAGDVVMVGLVAAIIGAWLWATSGVRGGD
ncbi:MAG: hypothetical protein HY301_03305 [Verrucomicrobia bacterium]|nr:hypothetical protein [Verrucomicrobiota bacterium]